jgi:uncharacterized Zn-finger protein
MSTAARKDTVVELSASDLNGNGGIFCPSPVAGMKLWDTHPRVFLDIAHGGGGQAKCPYCGTVYKLRDGEQAGRGH